MNARLRFSSLFDLWQFKEVVQVANVEVLVGERVLIGDFREAAIELAQKSYKAEVINTREVSSFNAT